MLKEFRRVSQPERGFRRMFSDEHLQLYVWYAARGGPITGFQLVYEDKRRHEALTWTPAGGWQRGVVADGDSARFNRSPILVAGARGDIGAVSARFRSASLRIEASVRAFVLDRMVARGA